MAKIGQPPPPPPREVTREGVKSEQPKKSTESSAARGNQAAATVQMEALAQRVKSGQAVGGAALLTQKADQAPAQQDVKKSEMTPSWAIKGLLDDDGHGSGGQAGGEGGAEEGLPEIPLAEIPYDVVTSPLGRAYRTIRWLQAVTQAEAVAVWLTGDGAPHDTPALQDIIAAVRAHQTKRRAVAQAESFFRSERQRVQQALNRELAALLAQGKPTTPQQHYDARRFVLPSAILSSPPTLELADLDASTATPADDTLGGTLGTLTDLELLIAACGERKGKLIDDSADLEAAWSAIAAALPVAAST